MTAKGSPQVDSLSQLDDLTRGPMSATVKPSSPASLAHFYRAGPYAPYVHEIDAPACSPISLFHASNPAGCFPDPPTDDYCLQLVTRAAGQITADLGDGPRSTAARPDDLYLAPRQTRCNYQVDSPFDALMIVLPAAEVARLLANDDGAPDTRDFGRLHTGKFTDPFAAELTRRMWDEAAANCPNGRLFVDAALLTLLNALRSRSAATVSGARRGGIAVHRLRRVIALLESRVAGQVSLHELAAEAQLSVHHFCREFRRETGLPPHRYMQRLRVLRAKELLTRSDLRVIDVAAAVGYNDPAHFAKLFYREVGTNPSAYRRQRRS